jgi:hypothetical protein
MISAAGVQAAKARIVRPRARSVNVPPFSSYQKRVLAVLALINFVNYIDRQIPMRCSRYWLPCQLRAAWVAGNFFQHATAYLRH